MANISGINGFIIQGLLPQENVGVTNNREPTELYNQTFDASDTFTTYDFTDGNNDGRLSDAETVGSGSDQGGTGGDRLTYDGTETFAQSLWAIDVTYKFSDGHEVVGSTRAFVTGVVTPSGNVLTGDVIVNPIDTVRAQINDYLSNNPGVTLQSYTFPANDQPNTSLNTTTMNAQDDPFVVCFGRGTLIQTDAGMRQIEDLRAGDMVLTRDNGLQPVRWTGARKLLAEELVKFPQLCPIRVCAGALGENLPETDLTLSPQHRVLVRSKIAQRMFGTDEVLVAVRHLLELDGIEIAEDITEPEYFHILFDRHEVIFSNGAETESLHTGPQALMSVGPAAQEEIFTLFPELRDQNPATGRAIARPSLPGRMARQMVFRHKKNKSAVVSKL